MPGRSRPNKDQRGQAIVDRLSLLRDHRAPFAGLARTLVQQVLDALPIPAEGPVVEIGAGDGQLRSWLPPSLLPRVVHTEPQSLGVEQIRQADPEAKVEQASAEQLPFEDGQVAAVIGLCVLDTIGRADAVTRELRRVLRPGGYVIHLLDMTPEIGPALRQLSRSEILPLPNVFTDPCAASWTEDLFLVPRRQIKMVIDVLRSAEHPGWRVLNRYRASLTRRPFSASRAADAFNAINDDGEIRQAFRQLFREAIERASPEQRQALAGFEGRPVSSARFLSGRLRESLSPGFVCERDEILVAAERQPRTADQSHRYLSRTVGYTRELPHPPTTCLASPTPPSLRDDERLVELGMHAYVARRENLRGAPS